MLNYSIYIYIYSVWCGFSSKCKIAINRRTDHQRYAWISSDHRARHLWWSFVAVGSVRSWIRGVEFTITPRVVAEALGVPVVSDPIYPHDESPPIDEVMSHITGSSIQWGFDPRITSSVLSETAYLFLRVACHSLWPISHLHTVPLERCVFLYAFMSGVSISFPHLFLRSLNEVYRSSAIGHALIYPGTKPFFDLGGPCPPPPQILEKNQGVYI